MSRTVGHSANHLYTIYIFNNQVEFRDGHSTHVRVLVCADHIQSPICILCDSNETQHFSLHILYRNSRGSQGFVDFTGHWVQLIT